MIAPGVLTLGAFFLVPLGSVLVEAGREQALARFFGSADLLDALWRSVVLGVIAGLAALIVGVPVALHLSRMSPRARAVLQVLIALPLTFSGLIVAYGFILVLGRAGFVTLLLAELGADPAAVSSLLYGPFGLVLAYVYYLSPRVILLVLPVLTISTSASCRPPNPSAPVGSARWPISCCRNWRRRCSRPFAW